MIDGVEIDYTSNELRTRSPACSRATATSSSASSAGSRSSPLARAGRAPADRAAFAVEAVYRHYRGFAHASCRSSTTRPSRRRRALYVLRTTLTGIHVLRSGHLVTDVTALLDEYGLSEARELVEQKRAGERVVLDEALRDKWRAKVERAFGMLDDALATSPLPADAPNRDELEAWMLQTRRRRWDQ